LVEYAMANNLKVRGHCLIWFYRMPNWFFKNESGKLISKDLLYTRMESHIAGVMNRYKGKIYCYDVLNEVVPFNQGKELFNKTDTFYQIAGEEYVEKAFRFARKADPSAKLYYNDAFYDREKRDKIFRFLKMLKSKNVPIDGVGIQCHFGIDGISQKLLEESIDLFASLGLEIQITELDVSIFNKDSKKKDLIRVDDSYTSSIESQQADIYDMVFSVCRSRKNVVKSVTFWAPADINKYLTVKLGKRNYPYLFDSNLTPKKAYYKVVSF
jgi:endo-1,4-beta-xylanase